MGKKIIITKEGFDARSEEDPNNQIFNSDYGTLKYFDSGSNTQSITIGAVTHVENSSVAHNLGYKPFVSCYVKGWDGNYQPIPMFFTGATTSTRYGFYVDNTTLYFKTIMEGFTLSDNYTVVFYYFIFANNTGL